ncbi:MAG: hypothetical protein VSS75_020235, partial [Candidatus Parabeggiatoa sp.]|nr:hypothetical protein [Candidatus Parabeggiatoa sp.]
RISGSQEIGPFFFRSGINNSSTNPAPYAGPAGNIEVTARHLSIGNGGAIDTSAVNAGGGNITINATDMIYLFDQGRITTSVQSGIEDGGNIDIANSRFILLNQGQITAQADAGNGGNIRIVAEQFIKSYESLVCASSRLGLDGNVQIDSPDIDMDAFMVILPGGYVEAQLKHCTTEEIENPSTFKIDLTRQRTVPFGKVMKLK